MRFKVNEYLVETINRLSLLKVSLDAIIAPSHNEKIKDIISPNNALPYIATNAIVAMPSPVNITGVENTRKIVNNPKGSPIK